LGTNRAAIADATACPRSPGRRYPAGRPLDGGAS